MPVTLSSASRRNLRALGAPTRSLHARRGLVSLLDFGTDTIKAAVVERVAGDVRMLGYGFASAKECDLSGGRTAVTVLASAADEALTAAEDGAAQTVGYRVVPDDVVCCLPARSVSGQLFTVRLSRADATKPITAREVNTAWERLERLVRDSLADPAQGNDLRKPLSLTRSTVVVDGHPVTDPVGLKGQAVSVSAFAVAVHAVVLRALEAVIRRLEVCLLDVVAAPQSLVGLVPQHDALLLDVGRQGTSLSLVRGSRLVATHWWPQGGDLFTRSLSDAFGCSVERAEALKRAHVARILEADDECLVRRVLARPVGAWHDSLVAGMTWVSDRSGSNLLAASAGEVEALGQAIGVDDLPGRIYLTGGGSLLPDLNLAVRSIESAAELRFSRAVEVESLGRGLGARLPNQMLLINAPAEPLTDLLAPVISLAASASW